MTTKYNTVIEASKMQVGDYIVAIPGLGKDIDLPDLIEFITNRPTLCQVEGVIDVPESYDFEHGYLSRKAPETAGGVVEITPGRWVPLVTVYRKPSGKHIFVDAEGFSYWRYVYLPCLYTEILSEEYARAVATIKEREKKCEGKKVSPDYSDFYNLYNY